MQVLRQTLDQVPEQGGIEKHRICKGLFGKQKKSPCFAGAGMKIF